MKKELKDKKKVYSYWWVILVLLVVIYLWTNNQKSEIKFVVDAEKSWYTCYNSPSNINLNYELSASSPIDIIFTATEKDAKFLNETSKHYPACYTPDVLEYKGSCIISGNGCFLLLNKNLENSSTISLKYIAKQL